MPDLREKTFNEAVFRGGLRLIQKRAVNSGVPAMRDPKTVAEFKAISVAFDSGNLSVSDGYVPLGGADGLLVSVLGGDAALGTVELSIKAFDRLVKGDGTGKLQIVGYEERFMGVFTWTLGTLNLFDGAGDHPLVTEGLADDDLWADTVVISTPAALPNGYAIMSPGGNYKAHILIPADGADMFQFQTRRTGTTADALVVGKRVQGAAMRGIQ